MLQELAAENYALAAASETSTARTSALVDHATQLHAELAQARASLDALHDTARQLRSAVAEAETSRDLSAAEWVQERGALRAELEQLRDALQSVGTQQASAQASSDVAYQDLSAELQAAQTRIRGLRAEPRTAQQSTGTTMSPSYPPLPASTSTPAADSSSSHSAIVPASSSAGLIVQISNLRHELARAQESERRAREASRMSSDRREQAEQRLLDVERENQRLQAAASMKTIRGDAYKASFDRNVEQRTQDNVEASEVVATLESQVEEQNQRLQDLQLVVDRQTADHGILSFRADSTVDRGHYSA
ncbi:hypothetical protein PR003_g25721 [Phytophthora rubi]|uniref:Uncharacterized protein n=1 Tax=Phytophthora rubi TaxID=129364 RepID=A0A6A4CE62_9STRA|nr:hypothetical protein PR003_g25721 [Phytophthora rubi]